MPTITSIQQQKKNHSRYSVFVDEEFYTGIDEDSLIRLSLKKGLELTPQDLTKLKEESFFGLIYSKVLDYLSRRPRSVREIEQYVSQKLYDREVFVDSSEQEQKSAFIARIVEDLISRSYLDDHEFARWWIGQRTQGKKPLGLSRIVSELVQKGVSPEITKRAWDQSQLSDSFLVETVVETIKDKYDLSDPKQKTRFINYLQRRGFSWETIKTMLQ
ncbi:hypothetical protein COY15_04395 [Candidatus Roizmanbacteria bacterium CG_4_10_14_0_2_um_filter_39_12]|nr:MAG: hypothetical protein COY15_04395 [Candidatus Roizmanbacteria bacterium CG_4_10_14_0_2_um_filter_39_12]